MRVPAASVALLSVRMSPSVDSLARLEESIGRGDPTPGPEEMALRAAASQEVRALLGQLPRDQRHVVELRLAGLTNQEIAESLGRSVAATKMLQLRAITRLRSLLTPVWNIQAGWSWATLVGLTWSMLT